MYVWIVFISRQKYDSDRGAGKSAELVHQLGFWLCFSFVISLFIFNIITYIPFGFLIYYFFFAPFLLMSWIALYENASGNLSVKSHEQITYVQ